MGIQLQKVAPAVEVPQREALLHHLGLQRQPGACAPSTHEPPCAEGTQGDAMQLAQHSCLQHKMAALFYPPHETVLVQRALHWSGQAQLDPQAHMVMCLGQGHRELPPALLQGHEDSLAGLRQRLPFKSTGPVSQQLSDVHRSAVAACSTQQRQCLRQQAQKASTCTFTQQWEVLTTCCRSCLHCCSLCQRHHRWLCATA